MEISGRFKKILMILGFVTVVIVIGYFLYSLFFKNLVNPATTDEPIATTTPGTGGLPVANTGTGGQVVKPGGDSNLGVEENEVTPVTEIDPVANGNVTRTDTLTNSPSMAATLSSDGNGLQYYNNAEGKFYRIDNEGNPQLLSDKTFYQVQSVSWSPQKDQAVLEYPDGANVIYDFNNEKQITLPSHWKEFSYSPNGEQIVFKSMALNEENRMLGIVSSDGNQIKGLEDLGDKDATVFTEWSPNNQIAAMFTEGKDFDRQEVYFVGLNGENFKSTMVEGRGFQPKWSPQGNELLYSVYSTRTDLKPSLWIVGAEGDAIGSNRRELNVNTWADKCSFGSAETLYCAVPRTLDEGAGMIPALAKNTIDDLYQIDTVTGSKKLIATPQGDYNINSLMVSEDQKNIFFTDSASGKIHKIQLK